MNQDEVDAIAAGGVSRKGWRNAMFFVGLLLLALATIGLGTGEPAFAAAFAVVALVWFIAARLMFPTDRS